MNRWGWLLGLGAVGAGIFFFLRPKAAAAVAPIVQPGPTPAPVTPPVAPEPAPVPTPTYEPPTVPQTAPVPFIAPLPPVPMGPLTSAQRMEMASGNTYEQVRSTLSPVPAGCTYQPQRLWLGQAADGSIRSGNTPTDEEAVRVAQQQTQNYFVLRSMQAPTGVFCGYVLLYAGGESSVILQLLDDNVPAGETVYGRG